MLGGLYVGLGEAGVDGDGFHFLVTEHGLQANDVAAIAEIVHSKSVAEAMDAAAGDAGSGGGGLNHVAQVVSGEGGEVAGGEQGLERAGAGAQGVSRCTESRGCADRTVCGSGND